MDAYLKKYIKASIAVTAILLIPMSFFNERFSLIISVLFGSAIRILTFLISYYDLNRLLTKKTSAAKRMGVLSYMKRYMIYGLTLAISIKSPYLNVFGCFFGLMALTVGIHVQNLIDIRTGNNFGNQRHQ